MAEDVFELAVDTWRRRGVPVLPPASEDEIARTFSELNQPLSRDIQRLYMLVNGFEDGACDGLWSLWSLERIRVENRGRTSPYLWFADWLICSHMYCFCYRGAEVSAVYIDHNTQTLQPESAGQMPTYLIAASVEVFLEKLLRAPEEVEAFD